MTEAFDAWRQQVLETAERLDDIDYFTLLDCSAQSTPAELRQAFRQLAQNYHPDRFSNVSDEALSLGLQAVYRRITEAYAVLRDPNSKNAYSAGLADGLLRYDPERSGRSLKAKQEAAFPGQTERGRHHFKRAQAAQVQGDLFSAKAEIRMALLYEPNEPSFIEMDEDLQGG